MSPTYPSELSCLERSSRLKYYGTMARRRVVRTIEGIVDVLGGNKAAISSGPGGSLQIPQSACVDAVKELTGSDPPHDAECSP